MPTDPTLEAHGRGAWSPVGKGNGLRPYQFVYMWNRDGATPDASNDHLAVNYGVKAIQNRLNRLGYRHPLLGPCPTNGKFGPRTRHAVKWFQGTVGLSQDGIVGSTTSGALWRPLVTKVANERGIDPALLWGQALLESSADPGAVSYTYKVINGPDYGLCQINLRFHPVISMRQAFTPVIALRYSADLLAAALIKYSSYEGGAELRINCAIAQHNSPSQADEWFETGFPPSQQIADYVAKVKLRMLTY